MTTDLSMGGGVERWILNVLEGLKDGDSAHIVGTDHFDKKRFNSMTLDASKVEVKKIVLLENKLSFFRKSSVLSFILDNMGIPFIIAIMRRTYVKEIGDHKKVVYLTKNQYWRLFRGSMIIGSNHSEFSRDSLFDILKAKLYAAGLIYRGIDAFHVFPGREKIKQILSKKCEVFEIPNGTKDRGVKHKPQKNNFLYVGRLETIKGIDRLIEAWRMMHVRDCTLTIAGTGSLDVRALSNDMDNVHVLGSVTDEELDRLYKEANYFIYPTRWDSFPMTVIEALSASCFVVTTETLRKPFIRAVNENVMTIIGPEPQEIAEYLDRLCVNEREFVPDIEKIHDFFMENYVLELVNRKFFSAVEKLYSAWIKSNEMHDQE